MKNKYTKEYYLNEKKMNKLILLFSIIFIIINLSLVGLSLLLIKENNVILFKIIDSVFLSISFIIFLFVILDIYYPRNKHNKLLYRLLTVNRYEYKAKIISINKRKLIQKAIYAYEIEIIDETNKTSILYIEDNVLEVNKEYILVSAKNFIVDVVEINND